MNLNLLHVFVFGFLNVAPKGRTMFCKDVLKMFGDNTV